MRMRDHRPIDRTPWIDKKAASLAIEALRAQNKQGWHNTKHLGKGGTRGPECPSGKRTGLRAVWRGVR